MKKSKKFNKRKALKHPQIEINRRIQDGVDEEKEFLYNFKLSTGIDFYFAMENMMRIGEKNAKKIHRFRDTK